MSAQKQATKCLEYIDQEGDPKYLNKREWVEMLEIVISDCESRLEAAREELEEDEG